MDTHTVVTHQSWGSRLGQSFKGILAGLVLFVLSFPLLFWNEGRTVHRAKALAEGEAACVESPAEPDLSLDGKLVHVTARAVSGETLTDDLLGVSAPGIRLRRVVEMYQWEEQSSSSTKKNLGGSTDTTTTYAYRTAWSGIPLDSSSFQVPENHANPPMPFGDETFQAGAVRAGGFDLSDSLVRAIGGDRPLPLGEGGAAFRAPLDGASAVVGGILYLRPGATNAADLAASPAVGDLRVSYRVVPDHDVSIVAKQTGTRLGPYAAKTGTVELLADGAKAAEEMFAAAKGANKAVAWLLRLAGFLAMLFGVRMVLGPLETLADVVPFVGRIVGFGTGLVAALVAVPCSLATIAVAWIAYRPVLGIALLAAAVAAAVLLARRGKARAAA